MSVEPLVVAFQVSVPPSQAFETWTRRCATWWPPSHTISGNPATITFEPHTGGRITEHEPDGSQHQWGEILDWEPPTRLRYLWHLFFDPSEATEVEVTFTPTDHGTAVRLEQRGWAQLGELGPRRRGHTEQAWHEITKNYIQASSRLATAGSPEPNPHPNPPQPTPTTPTDG
jgi:uncharacterized protein YndB with AHSA1/START domain